MFIKKDRKNFMSMLINVMVLFMLSSYINLQANENDSPVWVTWQERNKPLSNTQMSNLGHEKLHQSPVTIHNHYTDKNQATHTTIQKNQHTNWANNWLSRQKETSGTSSPVTRLPPPPQVKPNNTIITLKKNASITVHSVAMGKIQCIKKLKKQYSCNNGSSYNFTWTDQDGQYQIYLNHSTVQSVIDLSQQPNKTTLKTFSLSNDKSKPSTNPAKKPEGTEGTEGTEIDFKEYFPIKPKVLYDKENVEYKANIFIFRKNTDLYTQKDEAGCVFKVNINDVEKRGKITECWQRTVQLPNAVNLKAQSITTDQPLVSCYPEQQAEKIHCLSPLIIKQFSIFINHPKNKAFTATASQYAQEQKTADTSDPEETLTADDDTPIALRANGWSSTIIDQFQRLIDRGYHFKYQYTRKDGSISSTDSSLLPLSKDIIAGKEPFAGLERHFSHFPDYIHVLIFAPNPQDTEQQNKSCAVWNWTIGYQQSKGLDLKAINSACDTNIRLSYPSLLKDKLSVEGTDYCQNNTETSQIICSKNPSDDNTVNLKLKLSDNLTIKQAFSIENKKIAINNFKINLPKKFSKEINNENEFFIQMGRDEIYNEKIDINDHTKISLEKVKVKDKLPNKIKLIIKDAQCTSSEKYIIWNLTNDSFSYSPKAAEIPINITIDTAEGRNDANIAFFANKDNCEALTDSLNIQNSTIKFRQEDIKKLKYSSCNKELWLIVTDNSAEKISPCYSLSKQDEKWKTTKKIQLNASKRTQISSYALIMNDKKINKKIGKIKTLIKQLMNKGHAIYVLDNEGVRVQKINSANNATHIDFASDEVNPFKSLLTFINEIDIGKKKIYIITGNMDNWDSLDNSAKMLLSGLHNESRIQYLSLSCNKKYPKICKKFTNQNNIINSIITN